MTHAKSEQKQSDQIRAFRKAARELGADKTDERFKAALRTIAKAKSPSPEKAKHKGPADHRG